MLNLDDRVINQASDRGTVVAVDDLMAQVQFDHGGRPGWFSRDGDHRLTLT